MPNISTTRSLSTKIPTFANVYQQYHAYTMTHKHLIAMAAILSTVSLADSSAQPRSFNLENTVYGGKELAQLYPYSLSAWPCRNTDNILYYKPDYSLTAHNPDGSQTPVSSYNELGSIIAADYVRIIAAESPDVLWLTNGDDIFRVNIPQKQTLAKVPGPYDDATISNAGWVAYTSGCDLYVANGKNNNRVNKVSDNGIRYGSTVARSEFGIEGGMFWNHDGTRLCFYRKDERMVANYPLVDVQAREGKVVNTRYPMAGEQSEEVSIGIYDTRSAKTIYLKTTSPVDRYFTNISWSPDGSQIGIAEINRDQDHLWYNIYDTRSGNLLKTLFEETDPHWIEPCEPALWTDNSHFVWASYRNGYRHLYLYDTRSAKATQLTDGQWCVTKIYGFDNKNKRLIAQTNSEHYLYRDICAISLNGDMARISPEGAVCTATYLSGMQDMVINISSAQVAKESRIVNTNGNYYVVNVNADPYKDFSMPEIRLVDLKSADGVFPLTGRLILPTNFDPSKKYPAIVYVYGGPHSQLVDGSWLYGASQWMLLFAQEGYIVFTMDNRGTEMRGSAYEQAVHRQLGVHEMEDQMMGVEYLRSLPYVDQSRLGVHGWSFGGFMTISLLTTYPDVFKVGVAGGPVCDWKYYEVMYGEHYMDTPQQNPEGYASTSLLNKIANLNDNARLLVIHGAMDSTVVWQNSQALLNSSIRHNKFLDYYVYPNHPHNVSGHDRVHLIAYIKRYFDTFLKGEQ